MKYFLSAGIYHIDAVVIVLGCRPYLDVCDSEKTFFIFFFIFAEVPAVKLYGRTY